MTKITSAKEVQKDNIIQNKIRDFILRRNDKNQKDQYIDGNLMRQKLFQ